MGNMILTFSEPVNAAAQPGDMVYFTDDPEGEAIYPIGPISSMPTSAGVEGVTLNITTTPSVNRPSVSSFIFFVKDNEANSSALLGYYMDVELRNDSPKYAEVFSSGTEFFESSK
mgnify:CR=1